MPEPSRAARPRLPRLLPAIAAFAVGWFCAVANQARLQARLVGADASSGPGGVAHGASGVNAQRLMAEFRGTDPRRRARAATSNDSAVTYRDDPLPEVIPSYAMRRNYLKVPSHLPPLDTLVDPSPGSNHSIVGDVGFLLDFAIIGFGKCGTSTLMHWLGDHPETQVLSYEVWSLVADKPHELVARLHHSLQHPTKLRGFKCPGDLLQPHALRYYDTLWPRARLIVGVRHPIRHFESLYNFRVQNYPDSYMHHANRLIGPCFGGHRMTCTLKSDWAYYLFALGKQFGTRPAAEYQLSKLERAIVHEHPYRRRPYDVSAIQPVRNDVFLFELGQLGDKNETRLAAFQAALQRYLGLAAPLAPVHHFVPGKVWAPAVQAAKDQLKMDICEYQYIPLRRELLRQATLAADWIQQVFLAAPGVHSGNPRHLRELLATWQTDPCGPESILVSEKESEDIRRRTREAPENATKLALLEFLRQQTEAAPRSAERQRRRHEAP